MRGFAFACMLGLLAACGESSAHSQRAELAAHRALWADRGPRSYRYTYHPTGFAPNQRIEVTVTSGAVSSTTLVAGTPPAWSTGATVEALFDNIATRLDSVEACGSNDRCSARITYDESLGYPLSVSSGVAGAEDGVDGWDVSGLTTLN